MLLVLFIFTMVCAVVGMILARDHVSAWNLLWFMAIGIIIMQVTYFFTAAVIQSN